MRACTVPTARRRTGSVHRAKGSSIRFHTSLSSERKGGGGGGEIKEQIFGHFSRVLISKVNNSRPEISDGSLRTFFATAVGRTVQNILPVTR